MENKLSKPVPVVIFVTKTIKERLKHVAKAHGYTMSQFVRKLIAESISKSNDKM